MSQHIGFLQRVMKHICVQRRVSYFMASADILSWWHFAFIDCHANKMPFLRVSLSLNCFFICFVTNVSQQNINSFICIFYPV